MHRIRRHITILLFLIGCEFSFAQIQTTPSSAPCSCDGSVVYTNPLPGNTTYSLYGDNGLPLDIVTNAIGTFDFSGLCPSAYTLEIDQNGTVETLVFNIPGGNINPGNAAAVSICSTNGNSNLINFIPGNIAGGQWTDPDGNVHTGVFNPSNDNAGLYTYTIINSGCEVSTGVFISIIQNADPGDYVNYLICEDYVPFLMTDWMDDANGEWFDSLGNPVSGWFDPATMNTATFVYMIDTVVGCPPVFASMTVTENLIPDAGTDATVLVCSNGTPFNMTDYLGGTPQADGQWYDAFNNQVPDVFDPASMSEGIYRYRANGAPPCNDVNAYLTIVFTDTNPSGEDASVNLCSNGNAINMFNQLNGSPFSGGTWTNASNQPVDNFFDPSSEPSGVYSYYFPNVGCAPGNAELTINVEQLQSAGLNNNATLCESINSVNLTTYLSPDASPGGVWTNAGSVLNNPQITVTGPTNDVYTYSVNGVVCPDDAATISVVIDALTPPPGNIQFTICSESDPVDLQQLYSIDNLVFENNQGQIFDGLFDPSGENSQTVTVVAPSSNSCPDASSTIAIDVENPAFTSDTVQIDVCNSQVIFDLNTSNATIDFNSGNWYNESDIIIDSQIDLIGEIQASYYFESNVEEVCEPGVFVVEFNSYIPNEAGPDNQVVFCATDDAVLLTDLLPVATGGLGLWTLNNEPFGETQIDPENALSGMYAYTIPANGPCPADNAFLNITIQNGISYSAGGDVTLCHGDGPVVIGQDNPAGCTFNWTPAQNLDSPNNYSTAVNASNVLQIPVTFEYQVEVSDGICTVMDTVQVVVNPLPDPQLSPEYAICADEEIELNTGSNGTFNWEPSSLFEDPELPIQLISPNDTVAIDVTVTNQWGCVSQSATTILVHPIPYPVFTEEGIQDCPPVSWSFALDSLSTNCDQVEWDFGSLGIFEGSVIHSSTSESGIYNCTLTATSSFGCTFQIELGNLIEVYNTPNADFEWDPLMVTTLDPEVFFTDLSEDAVSYFWDFAGLDTSLIPEPTHIFPSETPGNYPVCLTVLNAEGCIDTQCEIIHLENAYIFYAPNSFTPDNDGINDVFLPVVLGFDNSTYELQIFNRWGDAIFTTNQVFQPWTGNVHNGSHFAEDGTYVWQVRIKDMESAEYRIYRGHLNLLR